MTASRVHAVIAAGLENPQLLERWQREPDLLRKCGVDPDKLDLNALWKFAGLTAKVRHAGQLRPRLPLTAENASSQVSGNFQVPPGLTGQETAPSRRFAQAYIDILWEHGDYRFAQAYQRLIIAA